MEEEQPKFTKEDYEKLDHQTLVEYCIKKDRRIKRIKRTRDERKEKAELYKSEMQNCMARNTRQKKDNNYQERTCALYRKILERFVDLPCESE